MIYEICKGEGVPVPDGSDGNTVEVVGVFYPFDGYFTPWDNMENAVLQAAWARTMCDRWGDLEFKGAITVKITVERLDK